MAGGLVALWNYIHHHEVLGGHSEGSDCGSSLTHPERGCVPWLRFVLNLVHRLPSVPHSQVAQHRMWIRIQVHHTMKVEMVSRLTWRKWSPKSSLILPKMKEWPAGWHWASGVEYPALSRALCVCWHSGPPIQAVIIVLPRIRLPQPFDHHFLSQGGYPLGG